MILGQNAARLTHVSLNPCSLVLEPLPQCSHQGAIAHEHL